MYKPHQINRSRSIGLFITALLILLASEASAQIQMAPGLELSAGTTFDGADPLWMLTDTRAISHDAGLRLLRCFDAPNNNVRNSLAGDYWIDSRLAVHPVTGEFYVFSATYRVIADQAHANGRDIGCGSCLVRAAGLA